MLGLRVREVARAPGVLTYTEQLLDLGRLAYANLKPRLWSLAEEPDVTGLLPKVW